MVHGGGKQMTRFLAERGIESRFVNGLRVTTPETVDAVLKVFAGSVNHELVASLGTAGRAGRRAHRHRRVPRRGRADGPGARRGGARDPLQSGAARPAGRRRLSARGGVRGGRPAGPMFTTSMRTRWRWPARRRFGAEKLVFLTDVDGVLDAAKRVRSVLTAAESERLIADGVATGGMQAKLNAAAGRSAGRRGAGADRAGRGGRRAGTDPGGRGRSAHG